MSIFCLSHLTALSLRFRRRQPAEIVIPRAAECPVRPVHRGRLVKAEIGADADVAAADAIVETPAGAVQVSARLHGAFGQIYVAKYIL